MLIKDYTISIYTTKKVIFMRSMIKFQLYFLSFGLLAAGIFPFYANFFVIWKPGMLKYFVIGCVLAGIFVGVGNFFVFKAILKKLKNIIQEKSEQVYGKEVSETIATKDLFDSVINKFNGLIEHLLSTLEKIKRIDDSLKSQINRTIAITDDMQSSIGSIEKNVQQTNILIKSTYDEVQKTESNLTNIKSSSQSSLSKAISLSENSNEIKNIISAIESITFQTKLLSLNAAVEAARAGEKGKGFAVVADEISEMSMQATESTSRINEVISKMIFEIEESRTMLDESTQIINDESLHYEDVKKTLNDMIENINVNAQEYGNIIEHIKQLSEVNKEISELING